MMIRISVTVKITLCLVALSLLSACSAPTPQPFDSKKWLSGDDSVRGSMVQDIKDRRLLEGKTKGEVEQLLGKPDFKLNEWVWAYEVVTISRCHFWTCGMELGFDPQTGKSSGGVAISD